MTKAKAVRGVYLSESFSSGGRALARASVPPQVPSEVFVFRAAQMLRGTNPQRWNGIVIDSYAALRQTQPPEDAMAG